MSLRRPDIMAIARREGRVAVDDLVARLGVTPQTVRRDLAALAAEGALTRVHGGAVLASGTANLAWEDRRAMAAPGKAAIARAAAARIAPGDALFLNIGTTTGAVAEALRDRPWPEGAPTVVTNDLRAAHALAGGVEVILTGGRLRPADQGLVGELAAEGARQFRPDWAVIGCSALGADGALLDYDLAEVGVARAMLAGARRRMLVADASKADRHAPVRIASLEALDLWITDAAPPAPLAALCAGWGTEILVAPPPP